MKKRHLLTLLVAQASTPLVVLACLDVRSAREQFLDGVWISLLPLWVLAALVSTYFLFRMRSPKTTDEEKIRLCKHHSFLLATLSLLAVAWLVFAFWFVAPSLSDSVLAPTVANISL